MTRLQAVCVSLFLAVVPVGTLAAREPRVNPLVPPGAYRAAQLVDVERLLGARAFVSVDGGPFVEMTGPIVVDASPGTESSRVLSFELRPIDPLAPALASFTGTWVVDRKPPDPPALELIPADGGNVVRARGALGGDTVRYAYAIDGRETAGVLDPKKGIFVPSGAALVLWSVDRAGNRGDSVGFPGRDLVADFPFRVRNPLPGSWANRQTLLVDAPVGADVRYTIDGSDPAVSGRPYVGPELIAQSGMTMLRVALIAGGAIVREERVLFSQEDAPVPEALSSLSRANPVELGSFGEVFIPEGYSFEIGQAVKPRLLGPRRLSVSALPGTRRFYPITVSDGLATWRWILASGQEGRQTASKDAVTGDAIPATDKPAPKVSMHDWEYLDVYWPDGPVYASLDGEPWRLLASPLRVDRRGDHSLRWYAETWNGGKVQSLSLPRRPSLRGLPANGATVEPVYLSVDDSPFDVRYSIGSFYAPTSPTAASPSLGKGILIEPPADAEGEYAFRASCVIEGVIHGELFARFTVDRKPPEAPAIIVDAAGNFSRAPIRLRIEGEGEISVSISPPVAEDARGEKVKTFILAGDPERPISYTVTASASDRAGNRSAVATRTLTVDLGALYVGASPDAGRVAVDAARKSDGSPDAGRVAVDAARKLDGSPDAGRVAVDAARKSDGLPDAGRVAVDAARKSDGSPDAGRVAVDAARKSDGSPDAGRVAVDAARKSDGSPDAPFPDLDSALDWAVGPGPWRIYVSGRVQLARRHRLAGDVSVLGSDSAAVVCAPGAGIDMAGGRLAVSRLEFSRAEPAPRADAPLVPTRKAAPLMSVEDGSLSVSSASFAHSGGDAACLVRVSRSSVTIESCEMSAEAADYAVAVESRDSTVTVRKSKLSATARATTVIAASESSVAARDSSLISAAQAAGRAIELAGSSLSLEAVSLARLPAGKANADAAIGLDSSSRVDRAAGVRLSGFDRLRSDAAAGSR